MKIVSVVGIVCSANFEQAVRWYETLFDRSPDAMPTPVVAEWQISGAIVQLIDEPQRAGGGRIAFFVDDIDAYIALLISKQINPSEAMDGMGARMVEIEDIDGNILTFAQPQNVWSL